LEFVEEHRSESCEKSDENIASQIVYQTFSNLHTDACLNGCNNLMGFTWTCACKSLDPCIRHRNLEIFFRVRVWRQFQLLL